MYGIGSRIDGSTRSNDQTVDSLMIKVDALASAVLTVPCDKFTFELEGVDSSGVRRKALYNWDQSDTKKKLFIVFNVFVNKFVVWMQAEFIARGISYTIISSPVHSFEGANER